MPIPALLGVSGRTEFHGRPIEEQPTGGGLFHARQDFHQCRLAGSVFADKDVNRAGVDREIDLVKREGSRETFRDLLSDKTSPDAYDNVLARRAPWSCSL